nr:hypothetical transcript [Hymenolepis microstoma]
MPYYRRQNKLASWQLRPRGFCYLKDPRHKPHKTICCVIILISVLPFIIDLLVNIRPWFFEQSFPNAKFVVSYFRSHRVNKLIGHLLKVGTMNLPK